MSLKSLKSLRSSFVLSIMLHVGVFVCIQQFWNAEKSIFVKPKECAINFVSQVAKRVAEDGDPYVYEQQKNIKKIIDVLDELEDVPLYVGDALLGIPRVQEKMLEQKITPKVEAKPKQDAKLTAIFKPKYPPISRKKGEEGIVGLKIYINPKGKVYDVALAQSSGYTRLDDAAIKGAFNIKFQPAMQGDNFIASVKNLNVRFELQ